MQQLLRSVVLLVSVLATLALLAVVLLVAAASNRESHEQLSQQPKSPDNLQQIRIDDPKFPDNPPRQFRSFDTGRLTIVWEDIRDRFPSTTQRAGHPSNIHPTDYVGPEACVKCHKANYEAWSRHPHRRMNALASSETVKGDFSGTASMTYRGGECQFFQEGDEFRMRLERDGVVRLYRITQTIGSRFFQYYVGRGISGPEPSGHPYYGQDHVLPFGYWLERRMWVPIVHVEPEMPDERRRDPFDPAPQSARNLFVYAESCSSCHTTVPLADKMIRQPLQVGRYPPSKMKFSISSYLAEFRSEIWDGSTPAQDVSSNEVERIRHSTEAQRLAVTLGVSCEACHLGCRAHAEGRLDKPQFLPTSHHLMLAGDPDELGMGRTRANVNWVCSRCHTGERPSYAAGMGTWNSIEFTDAALGGCYSQRHPLTCIHCHDPHEPIGLRWSKPPSVTDTVCLECHGQYADTETRREHTHHAASTRGDHCLDCHMPRVNEGLQDVVRTHMIHSPTRADMIEANHPNACNLCHLEQPMEWTLKYLDQWYGKKYASEKITAAYPHLDQPVARGWVRHDHESVRLVAAAAIAREDARWALPELIGQLDDDYLLNRQFAQIGLERMFDVRLEDFGYRFYMMCDERQAGIATVRSQLLGRPAASQ
jgi:hypothetical protein